LTRRGDAPGDAPAAGGPGPRHRKESVGSSERVSSLPDDALTNHKIEQERLENAWRRESISKLLNVFYIINGAVLLFLFTVWLAQTLFASAPRLMSEHVLLALIAGSTAQLGALAAFVGRSLVPSRK
jgi:hypothetical protein